MRHFANSADALWNTIKIVFRGGTKFEGEGFTVKSLSTWQTAYQEGDRVLTLGTGIGTYGTKWYETFKTVEIPEKLQWDASCGNGPISEEQKQKIILNIRIALEYRDVPYEIVRFSQ